MGHSGRARQRQPGTARKESASHNSHNKTKCTRFARPHERSGTLYVAIERVFRSLALISTTTALLLSRSKKLEEPVLLGPISVSGKRQQGRLIAGSQNSGPTVGGLMYWLLGSLAPRLPFNCGPPGIPGRPRPAPPNTAVPPLDD